MTSISMAFLVGVFSEGKAVDIGSGVAVLSLFLRMAGQ